MLHTLKHLRYFIAVADAKNISKAAKALHIAQPSLTSAINQLEDNLGTNLLIRYKAKGVALTPLGRKFVAEARQLLLHNEELTRSIGSFSKGMEGEMTLGCYTTIAPFFIPKLLNIIKKEHPNLRLDTQEKNLDELQADLFNGVYELAMLYNINLDSNLKLRTLKKCKPYIILPKDHSLASHKKLSLKTIQDEPYIMLDLPNSRDYFKNIFTMNKVDPAIYHKTRSIEMARCLVAKGYGYTILNLLPHHNQTYDNGEVVCVELEGKHEPLEIVLAHVDKLKITQQATLFSDFCVKNFTKF